MQSNGLKRKVLLFKSKNDHGEGSKMNRKEIQCDKCIHSFGNMCKKYSILSKPSYIKDAYKECEFFSSSTPLKVHISNETKNKVKGAVFGAVIADALGVPVEFSSRNERVTDPVKEMRAYGTYSQPFGTWSDDSSLLLCLVETIAEGYTLKGLAEKFVKYMFDAYMTPFDSVFDIGNATAKAIRNIKSGISPEKCGGTDISDNGNGSLMRILPLAFYIKDMPVDEQIRIIEEISSVTHGHPVSVLGCIIYIYVAINLFNGMDKNQAYISAIDFVKNNTAYKYENYFCTYDRVLSGDIASLKEDEIKSTGYVVDTLEASLWGFLNEKSYADCVFRVINLGGDTDTIACVAGGLAGIYYGFNTINDNWVQMLQKKEMIGEMVNKFCKFIK